MEGFVILSLVGDIMGRKLKSALYTTLLFSVVMSLIILWIFTMPESENFSLLGPLMLLLLLFCYSAIGVFLYGIPVSYLSDIITKKLKRYRFIAAFMIYILFGYLTFFIVDQLAVFGIVCSLLFFLFEEIQRSKSSDEQIDKKVELKNSIAILLILALAWWGLINL